MHDPATTHYQIRVKGVLDGSWSAWFDRAEQAVRRRATPGRAPRGSDASRMPATPEALHPSLSSRQYRRPCAASSSRRGRIRNGLAPAFWCG